MRKSKNPDSIGKFTFSVVLRYSPIVVAIIIGIIAVNIWSSEKGDQRTPNYLGFAMTAISCGAGVMSAVYAYQGIRHSSRLQEKHHKIDKTLELITLWDDETLASARTKVSEILLQVNGNVLDHREYLRNYLRSQSDARQDVTIILNLLEKVALCWEADLLDEILLKNFYHPIVKQCWDLFSAYVAERRLIANNSNLYAAVERMYDVWNQSLTCI